MNKTEEKIIDKPNQFNGANYEKKRNNKILFISSNITENDLIHGQVIRMIESILSFMTIKAIHTK